MCRLASRLLITISPANSMPGIWRCILWHGIFAETAHAAEGVAVPLKSRFRNQLNLADPLMSASVAVYDMALEPVAHDDVVIAAAEAFDKPLEVREVVAVVAIAHDDGLDRGLPRSPAGERCEAPVDVG